MTGTGTVHLTTMVVNKGLLEAYYTRTTKQAGQDRCMCEWVVLVSIH